MVSSRLLAEKALNLVENFLTNSPKHPLIVLIGPTASGKTALSISLAFELQKRGCSPEIINADSRQFYRYLDVGTAKISSQEMHGIPHHLLSILDPSEDTSIAWFQREVKRVTDEVYARGALPILVGGSMLYVSAIVDGLSPMKVDLELRKELSHEYDLDSGASLHARLTEVDPETASKIPRENKVYVLRALEMYQSTGVTKSSLLKRTMSSYDTLLLCLDPPKAILDARILERTRQMFASGWVDEVRGLIEKGYSEKDPALMSHGYREILSSIRNGSVKKDTPSLIEKIASKGRQYAKRHRTWWKGDSRVSFLW